MQIRTSSIAIIAAGTLLAAAPSKAQTFGSPNQLYGGLVLGSATYFDQDNLEYDYLGIVFAGQVGMHLSPDLRVEGELAYQSTEAEVDNTSIDVDVTAFRGSISAYYDFLNLSLGGLTPYAGGGVGITAIEFEFDDVFGDDDETELSAHIEGGGSLKLDRNFEFVPAARWELTDDASNIQFRVGTRYRF